ncbi:hypothetical protein ACFVAJ_18565 [Agromyces sp. NPDC057679]|uniref:hypothetical protein n=1 Tax=Agromyces sp. NPDC057679 TaxID=3346207 RepID=UPI00366ACB4C
MARASERPTGRTGIKRTISAFIGMIVSAAIVGASVGPAAAEDLPEFTGNPAVPVSGSPWVGQNLTASPAGWVPTPVAYSYQWLRDSIPIPGATLRTLKLSAADVGAEIKVEVTGTKVGLKPRSAISAPTIPAAAPFFAGDDLPTVSGLLSVNQTLQADPGNWTPLAYSYTYQWNRDGVAIPAATNRRYVTTAADRGHILTVDVTANRTGYTSRTWKTAEYLIEDYPPIIGGVLPVVSGEVKAGQQLKVTMAAGLTPVPTGYTYQWNVDGQAVAGATGTSYNIRSSDIGTIITVTVTATHPDARPYVATSAPAGPVAGLSEFTGDALPTISGVRATEQLITATSGAGWSPAATKITYQWIRDGQPIVGATARTYTPTAADIGTNTAVSVTYEKDGFNPRTWVSSDSIITVDAPEFTGDDSPVIKGIRQTGQTLTASQNTGWQPTPTTIRFQWLRDGQLIVGATAATFRQTAVDVGHMIDVRINGTKTGYRERAWVTATDIETVGLDQFAGEDLPQVTGERRITKTLTVTRPTSWSPLPAAVKYQWLRDGQLITGARAATYTQTVDDVGHVITVAVTATKVGVAERTWESAAADETLGAASFTGDDPVKLSAPPFAGVPVRAVKPGTWSPAPTTFKYQWFADGQPIAGAIRDAYTPTVQDIGKVLTVAVTGSKVGYLDRIWSSGSGADATVKASKFIYSGGPSLTGKAQASYTLNVTVPAGVKPSPSSWGYQWFRDGQPIDGATKKTYLLAAADVGTIISVKVTAIKSGYEPVSWTVKLAIPIADLWDFVGDDLPWISLVDGEDDSQQYGNGKDETETGSGGKWENGSWVPGSGSGSGGSGSGSGSGGGSNSDPAIPGAVLDPNLGVKGDFQVGWRIYARPGNWTPRPTKMTYQWYREGVPIVGATSTSYTPTAEDLGKQLQVAITGVKTGYKPKTWVSAKTPAIKPMPTFVTENLPTIKGDLIVGARLTAARPAGVAPTPSKVQYQWLRDGQPIAGKTAATYALTPADVGHKISVKATMVRTAYVDRTLVSAETAPVKAK